MHAERRLPYQHDFHAGNFADVMKHTVLVLLLQRMCDKASPFMYVDTHAGAGSYDLGGKAAQLNEQVAGISLLHAMAGRCGLGSLPAPAQRLVELSSAGRPYPGSPLIAAELLRPQDSLLLCELSPEPHARLCRCPEIDALIGEGRARVLCADGYKAVRSRDAVATPQKRCAAAGANPCEMRAPCPHANCLCVPNLSLSKTLSFTDCFRLIIYSFLSL